MKNIIEFNTTTQALIYALLKYNEVSFNTIDFNNSMFEQQIPKIQLGRRVGHTSMAKMYISDNPNKNFGIIGLTKFQYKDEYQHLKNTILIDTRNLNNIRGKTLDYIIIENSNMFFKSSNDFLELINFINYNISSLGTVKTKLIAIGS